MSVGMFQFVQAFIALTCFCSVSFAAAENGPAQNHGATNQTHLGFYLHAGWNYDYPFAAHSWQRTDYADMFHFLKELGYDRVMLWPLIETIPPPLSTADARDLHEYRKIVTEAQRAHLECWLVFCANLTVRPETSTQRWNDRTLMPNIRVMHFDQPLEKSIYLEHRAKIISILNNADGYVTIDGDPGGYAGAKAEDFLNVFRADHDVLQKNGTHPNSQKVMPWIWCGWGARGVWQEPIQPFVETELNLLKTRLPAPNEFLIGQCRTPFACRRINVAAAQKISLTTRSSMICYESVEYEPAAPSAKLQFDEIRSTLREEQSFLKDSRGLMANAQTPIMVLPGIYFFARAARDTNYLAKTDGQILDDFAQFLGGDPALLVPAWTCLRLDLPQLPDALPSRLRQMKLKGKAARSIPGGAKRYVEILAAQVESRQQLLRAIAQPASSPGEAAQNLAQGAAALIHWWKQHRYTFEHDQHHPFNWSFVEPSQFQLLRDWAKKNAAGKKEIIQLAVTSLSDTRTLPLDEAKARLAELCEN